MSKPDIENVRVLCTNIGLAVLSCQTAEKLINLCLLYLFPKKPIRTVEMLEQLDEQHRRKTLGQFVRALRERVGLAPEFDTLLANFLEHGTRLSTIWSA